MQVTRQRLLALVRFGLGTRLLLALFAVLVVAVVFIGLNDTPGYILGYLATTVIFMVPVRRWRAMKSYVYLFLASFFGIIFLSFFYVEVISRLAAWIGGVGSLQGTPLKIIEWLFTYIILFGGPVGMTYGFVGTVILGTVRLAESRSRRRAASQT